FLLLTGVHVGVVGLATVTSIGRTDSLFGSYERYGGLLPLAVFALLGLLIVALWWEEPGGLTAVASAITGAAAGVSAYVLVQAAGWDWIDWREPSGIKATFQGSTVGNSDFAGGYLGIALPFVVFIAGQARGRARWAWGVVATADVAGIVVTRSRGGLLAAAAAAAVTVATRWRAL